MPVNVEIIGDNAFRWCNSLESISIPNSVVDIGYNAFINCLSLKRIEVKWDKPSDVVVFDDVFEGVDLSRIELIVPKSTEHLYQVADVWKNFGKITAVSNDIIAQDNVIYSKGILEINNSKAERISIYSTSGQLIWSVQKNASPEKFNLGNLSRGFYIIHGQSGWSLKIII